MRPIAGEEILTLDQLRLEALFLGLRTREGIDMEAYRKRYGFDLCAERGDKIAQLAAAGLVRADGYRFSPTRRGLVCADFLARFLS
jgi:oxygen-independent coproporphyrinogen-3 oxidase